MADFVKLTGRDGRPVHVNLDRVEYVSADSGGALLVFTRLPWLAAGRLAVRESPEDVLMRSNTLTV